jgi:dTDP-4-dehydrorhamnose 3,5-epimerase
MNILDTNIPDVKILEPKVFSDARGYFLESFNQRQFEECVCMTRFVQDNESKSTFGVLRGLHYQLHPYAQSKLVRVIAGTVLDIAVDIRKGSSTFGQYVSVEISDTNKRMLFIPRGFAHGFLVLSEEAIFQYKCDNFYSPQHEGSIHWNDPSLNINWGLTHNLIQVSEKDENAPGLSRAKLFESSVDFYSLPKSSIGNIQNEGIN